MKDSIGLGRKTKTTLLLFFTKTGETTINSSQSDCLIQRLNVFCDLTHFSASKQHPRSLIKCVGKAGLTNNFYTMKDQKTF